MNNIELKGENLNELLNYLEDQQDTNQLPKDISVEPEFVESDETLSVSLTAIAISGLAGVITSVLIEFFKQQINKKSQNEITISRTNKNGDEIKIVLKNLTQDKVEEEVKKFMEE